MTSTGRRNRLRAVAVVAAGTVVMGLAGLARADEVASRACRGAIAKAAQNINKNTLKFVDGCHKAQGKLSLATAACNVVTPGVAPFDPKIKFGAYETKTAAGVDKKCLAGDPVLANYPTQNVDADLFPVLDGQAAGNTLVVAGGADLNLAKAKIKCHETILKERGKVFAEILKESAKCQALLDKTGTTFAGLDVSCVRTAVKAAPKSLLNIDKACGLAGVTSTDVQSCDPLPACVVDNATLAAQTSASSIYAIGAPVCGNGVVEYPEQCDDSNTIDGDSCSSSCETEGATCTQFPPNTVIGARTVTVSINVPGAAKLAGVQMTVDYPQFQAGIPGTGQSSFVQGALALLQDTSSPGSYLSIMNDNESTATIAVAAAEEFMNDGNLLTISMDACVDQAKKFCNRNQNITECCDATDINGNTCTDDNAPVACPGSSFPTTVGPGTPDDCCPADNACVSQAAATQCFVVAASDINGQPVSGVTCSVALAGN